MSSARSARFICAQRGSKNLADIRHVVVLMLENRSFDCMLGRLYPNGPGFDGLTGEEYNEWTTPDGSRQRVPVWNDDRITPRAVCIPDPDPGELFADIQQQIFGDTPGQASMGGFVANYAAQRGQDQPLDPRAPMHYFTAHQMPVLHALARAFAVSDRWFASAPCQTWPNRFFAHTGTAGGYVNNHTSSVFHMPSVFNRLDEVHASWRVFFHDIPQCAALTRLWPHVFTKFRKFEEFGQHAASGRLPAYSFIEPRYFTDTIANLQPNDQHPPHNAARGEELIAEVYNAVRQGPGWAHTLLIITYDEHGGTYDHVPPPAAVPPGGPTPDGFSFDRFGPRVPAVIISPYVEPGSVLRPTGETPFDHTSIIATLRDLFGVRPLTARDAAAPSLLPLLSDTPQAAGPAWIDAAAEPATAAETRFHADRPPSNLQDSLSSLALRLPAAAATLGADISRLGHLPELPVFQKVADAQAAVAERVREFLRG
jgi:phospholipase C